MRIAKLCLSTGLILISTASFALHSIDVFNHSNTSITAKTNSSPCSSIILDKGILKPGQHMTIEQVVEDMYCKSNCEVSVYNSRSCSGNAIATAHVDYHAGVTSINNRHTGPYHLSGSGYNLSIENGADGKKGWFDFLSL